MKKTYSMTDAALAVLTQYKATTGKSYSQIVNDAVVQSCTGNWTQAVVLISKEEVDRLTRRGFHVG